MEQVGIKSRKMYEIISNYGLRHEISLTCREYRYGNSIYILKCIVKYYCDGEDLRKVFKKVYTNEKDALKALVSDLYNITIENIDFQMSLPF